MSTTTNRKPQASAAALLLIGICMFSSGLLAGVAATSHVWITSARALREGAIAEYQNEQLILASRAQREGDAFRYVIHSLNAADAQAETGFRWVQWSRSRSYGDWFELPWASFPLLWELRSYSSTSPGAEEGRRILEAQLRAQAALALERFGQSSLADDQWRVATRLFPAWTREQLRELAEARARSRDEEYESAYLTSDTIEDFMRELQRAREGQPLQR